MKRRTKLVAILASIAVGVSMVGVGFASWVIANQTATGTASGNITADAVSDSSVSLEISVGATGQKVVFGAPATQETENAWLTNDSEETEALAVSFTLTVSENMGNISISLATKGYGDDEVDGFWKAVTDGYLSAPVVSVTSSVADAFSVQTGNSALSEGGQVIINRVGEKAITDNTTVTVTLTFGWGAKFGGENPYEYYGKLDYSTHNEDAFMYLNNLHDYLNGEDGLAYTVTFKGEAKS